MSQYEILFVFDTCFYPCRLYGIHNFLRIANVSAFQFLFIEILPAGAKALFRIIAEVIQE